jgi:hypothetical protein
MTWRPAALTVALSVVCAACATPRLKLPSVTGVPATDAEEALAAATAACSPLSSISLEIAVSGSISGGRMRGRLLAGVTRLGNVRLEAVAPAGQPVFILTNSVGLEPRDATLLLPGDNRFLDRGRFGAVLEAVTGIPLDASRLLSVLTACSPSRDAKGNALGDDWRHLTGDGGLSHVYLHREKAGPWRLVAMEMSDYAGQGWRAEYGNVQEGLPRTIRLVSGWPGAFDVTLVLSQVDLNPPLGVDAFRIRIPGTAKPITLDELKASGPLRANGR